MRMIKNDDEWPDVVKDTPLLVAKFTASWCGPCKVLQPHLEKMEKDFPNLTFVEVDVDEAEDTAAQNEIQAMPTTVIFKAGVEQGRVQGANPSEVLKLVQKLNELSK